MTPEQRLTTALDRAPAPVRFWWRDDDAGGDDARLLPLLRLAARRGAPVALAVVPGWLPRGGRDRIAPETEPRPWGGGIWGWCGRPARRFEQRA